MTLLLHVQRSERLAAENMPMNMEYQLPGIAAAIVHQTVAGLLESRLLGDLFGGQQQIAEQRLILRLAIIHCGDVLLGDDKQMDRRLRLNIVKSADKIVFVNFARRNRSFDDFAK